MAKGLLFALVRKGSKLNYLDDGGNTQSERERKVHYGKAKSRFQVSRMQEPVGGNATEGNSTQRTTLSKERRSTRKKLFDLTLQNFSKGCKMNRNSPTCSNNRTSTENASTQRDAKSEHRNKPMLVPSVASGYFVNECDSTNEEVITKSHGNEKIMPRIFLTDHDAGNSSTCKPLDNRPRVQYSRYGSLPQLRVDEKRKRPSSWTGESSPRLNDSTDSRYRKITNSLEAEQSRGLWVEALTISASPSTQRRNLGSANALRPKSRPLVRPDSSFERSGKAMNLEYDSLSLQTKDRFVKRASSWSRGDENVGDFVIARQNRKIDIFLPAM